MGVIKQGILGGFSGKVGSVVGSSWKGIAVMKAKPLSVTNPQTAAQTAQRDKMKGIVAVARILLAALIQPYWNPFAQKQSGYNAFVSENIDTFVGDVFTDYANFYSTRGALLGVVVSGVVASAAGNTITVTWTNNTGTADALGTDEMIFVVYNATQDYWIVDAGNDTRAGSPYAIPDAVMVAADALKVYTSCSRPNYSKVSDSVYNAVAVGA
jgi:hypothetical protein